jgi:RNA polymerase sigma factor (sigma-70 family)
MHWDRESLLTALQQAIQQVAEQKGEPFARSIAPIIMTNLDKGRVHHFLDGQANNQPEAYVWRVCEFYEKYQPYLTQIQGEQDPTLWLSLYNQLKQWSYNSLVNENFSAPPDQKLQLAADCATMAAGRLLIARFPYDTDFDPWAYVLVQNVTRSYLHKEYKASREEAEHLQPVDDWEEWEALLPPHFFAQSQQDETELRQALLSVIDQLASDARKQLILLHYFEGLPLAQIAGELGRSENAVHKLHHDALKNLRKIWEGRRDKYE